MKIILGSSAIAATAAYTLWPGAAAEEPGSGSAELPLEYDAAAIGSYWSKRPLQVVGRILTIGKELLPLTFQLFLDLKTRSTLLSAEERVERAADLAAALTRLGPLFIKFGQMLSIRPDLVPPEAIRELQKLCDAVAPYPTEDAIRMVELELGSKVSELFDGLDGSTTPIAAASLGQVFKVKLKDTGEVVAVKIQRPDMVEGIALDLYIMRRWASVLDYVKPKLTNQRPYDVKLIDTFGGASYCELDYINEGKNQDLFAEALASRVPEVRVPKVFWQCTSRRVITTEWIEGEQLAKSPPEVINRLTPIGVRCFLAQLLDIGVFHSDPHPGNLLVDQDGRLTLIDFGLCAAVEKPATKAMTEALVHLMAGDVPSLMHDAVALEFLDDSVNTETLLPILETLFNSAKLAAAANVDATGSPLGAVKSRRKQFRAVSSELNQIFFDYPFQVPEYFALITRALITLEGIALTGDENFDLFQASYPYAVERAVTMLGAEELRSILSHAAAAGVTLSDAAAAAGAAATGASSSAPAGVGARKPAVGYTGAAWWDTAAFVLLTAKHAASGAVRWLYPRSWS